MMSGLSTSNENQCDGDATSITNSIQVHGTSPTTLHQQTMLSEVPTISSKQNEDPTDIGQPEIPPVHWLNMPTIEDIDAGYDTDNQIGPFLCEGVDEDESIGMEEDECNEDNSPDTATDNATNFNHGPVMSTESVKKMKVKELRDMLKDRGLSMNGKKNDLVDRLVDAIEKNIPLVANLEVNERENLVLDKEFAAGSRWELMKEDEEVVDESDMVVEGTVFVGPTEDAPMINDELNSEVTGAPGSSDTRNKKRNYSRYIFDRPPFMRGKIQLPERIAGSNRFKLQKRNNGERKAQIKYHFVEGSTNDDTIPNLDFLFEHNIGLESHPSDWMEIWLPFERKKDMAKSAVTIEDLTTWSNMKAMLSNAGANGKHYKSFQPFTMREVRSFFGLLFLQGISPSPQIEMKFKSHNEDTVNGSNLCNRVFGSNGTTRFKEFKAFFAAVNPLINPPATSRSPNHKVDPMLHQLMDVSKKAIVIGKNISVDEMDISFQGQHKDKQRINYKRDGDGFLVDALCSDGYCYAFYFRNQPPPRKWTEYKLSPLHSRVMSLFEQLPKDSRNYHCKMDNLFMSARFAKVAKTLTHSMVMIHGVTRVHNRGIPKCIETKKETTKAAIEKVRGTLKVARLVGDSGCELVAACLYDIKPVYLLSSSCEKVEWVRKTRKLWHKGLQRKVEVPFYRLNLIDDYNFNMNNVDMADQLRLQYKIHNWIRNRKWWWSIFFWILETSLTNCFVCYKKFMIMHNRKPMGHYEFIRAIALAWIDPDNYSSSSVDSSFINSSSLTSVASSLTFSPLSCDGTSSIITTRAGVEREIELKKNKKATRFSAASLDPHGALHMRLNKNLDHFPMRSPHDYGKCQLHKFRDGTRVRSRLMYCSDCNVLLCIDCWVEFHSNERLFGAK